MTPGTTFDVKELRPEPCGWGATIYLLSPRDHAFFERDGAQHTVEERG